MNVARLTDRRRDLLAKTLMDLAKIFFAAMLASRFFIELPNPARIGMALALIGLVASGMLVCPPADNARR